MLNWKILLLSDRNKMMCHWFYRTTKLEYARYANNMLLMLKKLTKYWTSDNIIIIGQGNFLKETGKSSISFYWILIILLQTTVYTTRLYSYCILKSCRPCHFWTEYWFCKCVFHMCVYHSVLIQLHKFFFLIVEKKKWGKS